MGETIFVQYSRALSWNSTSSTVLSLILEIELEKSADRPTSLIKPFERDSSKPHRKHRSNDSKGIKLEDSPA